MILACITVITCFYLTVSTVVTREALPIQLVPNLGGLVKYFQDGGLGEKAKGKIKHDNGDNTELGYRAEHSLYGPDTFIRSGEVNIPIPLS